MLHVWFKEANMVKIKPYPRIINSLMILALALQIPFHCHGQPSVVVTRKGNTDLEILSTEPESPATLQAGEKVYVTFDYDMGEYEAVQIWVRPRTNGAETKGRKVHKSPVYRKYDGAKDQIQGYFFFDDPVVVDEIIVRMKDKASGEYVCVAKKDASFKWEGSTNVKASLRDDNWDEELLEFTNKTKEELKDSTKHDNEGALVYRIHLEDELSGQIETKLYWNGRGHGGYRPDRASAEQIKVMFGRDGQMAELVVTHPDYHEFIRPVIFKKGKVVVWDDIVLERVSPENSCTITGTVYLEDDVDAADTEVSCDNVSTTTDANGNFTLTGLRSGQISIRARKAGYHGLYATAEVARGQTASCKMNGYRTRKAKVRWAYQPDNSKGLGEDNIVTGTAFLQDNELDRVSFAEGFKQTQGRCDFRVHQRKDDIIMNTSCGRDGPAITETYKKFEDVNEVPDFDQRCCRSYTLGAGNVYVFRCRDSKHYAKMEVLEIID